MISNGKIVQPVSLGEVQTLINRQSASLREIAIGDDLNMFSVWRPVKHLNNDFSRPNFEARRQQGFGLYAYPYNGTFDDFRYMVERLITQEQFARDGGIRRRSFNPCFLADFLNDDLSKGGYDNNATLSEGFLQESVNGSEEAWVGLVYNFNYGGAETQIDNLNHDVEDWTIRDARWDLNTAVNPNRNKDRINLMDVLMYGNGVTANWKHCICIGGKAYIDKIPFSTLCNDADNPLGGSGVFESVPFFEFYAPSDATAYTLRPNSTYRHSFVLQPWAWGTVAIRNAFNVSLYGMWMGYDYGYDCIVAISGNAIKFSDLYYCRLIINKSPTYADAFRMVEVDLTRINASIYTDTFAQYTDSEDWRGTVYMHFIYKIHSYSQIVDITYESSSNEN